MKIQDMTTIYISPAKGRMRIGYIVALALLMKLHTERLMILPMKRILFKNGAWKTQECTSRLKRSCLWKTGVVRNDLEVDMTLVANV